MKKSKTYWKLKNIVLTLVLGLALIITIDAYPYAQQASQQQSIESRSNLDNALVADKDNDGIDDFTDIMLGARQDALNMPTYDDRYWGGGYPPDDIGVCADVIWRALMAAGYNLKDLIDADIANHPEAYPRIKKADPNIDFRRTRNLKIFFDRHLVKLTLDIYDIDQWQAGDIVIFYPDYHHIGIVSDQRNFLGVSYLIHNTGQKDREEDIMMYATYHATITAHYRWIYK